MDEIVNSITVGDAATLIATLPSDSIHCCISDIPYGISLDDWDILHNNTNTALLGQSPAQKGKSGFKRRGKPIRGWSEADRQIPKEYQDWCYRWSSSLYPKMKEGASVFIFGARRTLHRAIVALEDSGFLLKDILAWKKPGAHHRAQRISIVLSRRGLNAEAERWKGWRLGNLAPIWEPIAWFFKPYPHTITDTVLKNQVGAMNVDALQIRGKQPGNLIECGFGDNEKRWHEAQKPLALLEFLIRLSTRENQIVLDPFIGSGSTAVACQNLHRRFIGFDIDADYVSIARSRLALSSTEIRDNGSPPAQQIRMFDRPRA